MYELMVIGNVKVDSDQLLSRMQKMLSAVNASAVRVEKLGRKLLAYPIAKQTEGEYLVFNFEAEGAAISEIDQKLRLEQENVLRYLIVKQKETKVSEDTASRGPLRSEASEFPRDVRIGTKVSKDYAVVKVGVKEDNKTKVKTKKAIKRATIKVKGKK